MVVARPLFTPKWNGYNPSLSNPQNRLLTTRNRATQRARRNRSRGTNDSQYWCQYRAETERTFSFGNSETSASQEQATEVESIIPLDTKLENVIYRIWANSGSAEVLSKHTWNKELENKWQDQSRRSASELQLGKSQEDIADIAGNAPRSLNHRDSKIEQSRPKQRKLNDNHRNEDAPGLITKSWVKPGLGDHLPDLLAIQGHDTRGQSMGNDKSEVLTAPLSIQQNDSAHAELSPEMDSHDQLQRQRLNDLVDIYGEGNTIKVESPPTTTVSHDIEGMHAKDKTIASIQHISAVELSPYMVLPSPSGIDSHEILTTALPARLQQQDVHDVSDWMDDHNSAHLRPESEKMEQKILISTDIDRQNTTRELYNLVNLSTSPWRSIWNKYQELEEPRASQIPYDLLRKILGHLTLQDPDDPDHIRGDLRNAYFTIIEDMARSDVPFQAKDWNTAIHFALKSRLKIGEIDLEESIQIWKKMELQHHCNADSATFTILYLAAAKAGIFGVADRLWSEMNRRGLLIDRMARIVQIIVGGLRRDRKAIINAYLAMVQDNQLVDINVMNTVIMAFCKAGEIASAEEVLRRMKIFSASNTINPNPTAWRERRSITKMLKHAPELKESNRKRLQTLLHIRLVPEEKTYRPLINYEAVVKGDFGRVKSLLEEMSTANIPISHPIFYLIMRGFQKHAMNGSGYWTTNTLQDIIKLFEYRLKTDPKFAKMDGRLPLAILEAYIKLGLYSEAITMWKTTVEYWEPPLWVALRYRQLVSKFMDISSAKNN